MCGPLLRWSAHLPLGWIACRAVPSRSPRRSAPICKRPFSPPRRRSGVGLRRSRRRRHGKGQRAYKGGLQRRRGRRGAPAWRGRQRACQGLGTRRAPERALLRQSEMVVGEAVAERDARARMRFPAPLRAAGRRRRVCVRTCARLERTAAALWPSEPAASSSSVPPLIAPLFSLLILCNIFTKNII